MQNSDDTGATLCGGRKFHGREATTGKARLPMDTLSISVSFSLALDLIRYQAGAVKGVAKIWFGGDECWLIRLLIVST